MERTVKNMLSEVSEYYKNININLKEILRSGEVKIQDKPLLEKLIKEQEKLINIFSNA